MPADADLPAPARGFTTKDVALRFRVGEDKVRAWIARGVLRAINTADASCGKPRYVVTAEALAEFEKARTVSPPPKAQRKKPRKADAIDFYPGD